MSDEHIKPSMYDVANEFVDLANELSLTDKSGNIGVGLRYAAARYSAFEASMHAENLAADKEAVIEMYLDDYRRMLSDNIDDYIRHASN
jgi:hypothetical protein